jgi:phosphohistidine phosphatase
VRASARWSKPPRTEVRDSLYLASVDELVSAVQELGPDVGSVLIVAHSPGIEETASLLAIDEDTPQLQALRDRFPTCGLAVLECDSDWADAGAGRLRLQRFVTPRELNDAA